MSKKKKTESVNPPVTLVEDPFASTALDVAEAQKSEEPIDEGFDILEEDPNTTAERMEQLAAAVAEQVAQDTAAAEALLIQSGAAEPTAEELLAKQIQEDQALQAEDEALAQEIEAQNAEAASDGPPAIVDPMDQAEVASGLEALIFLAEKPATRKRLRELIGDAVSEEVFESALSSLMARFESPEHGIELCEVAGGFQFRTKVSKGPLLKKLTKVQPHRLSSGAMETLAIIAYKQPVMKEQVDAIRGVDSSYFVRGLLEKNLIQIQGRSELPGRPMLYETTEDFLSIFGIKDLSALPPLPEVENMLPASAAQAETDPRIKQMRKLVGEMNLDQSTSLLYDPKEDDKILSEIKERVSSIPTSVQTLEDQKAAEKAEKEAKKAQISLEPQEAPGNLDFLSNPVAPSSTEDAPSEAVSVEGLPPEESLEQPTHV